MSNLIQSQQKAPQLHLKEISIIPISVPSKAGKSTKTDPAVTNLQLLEDYGKKRCTDRYDSSESSDR